MIIYYRTWRKFTKVSSRPPFKNSSGWAWSTSNQTMLVKRSSRSRKSYRLIPQTSRQDAYWRRRGQHSNTSRSALGYNPLSRQQIQPWYKGIFLKRDRLSKMRFGSILATNLLG